LGLRSTGTLSEDREAGDDEERGEVAEANAREAHPPLYSLPPDDPVEASPPPTPRVIQKNKETTCSDLEGELGDGNCCEIKAGEGWLHPGLSFRFYVLGFVKLLQPNFIMIE
jgi:hypothetical protein